MTMVGPVRFETMAGHPYGKGIHTGPNLLRPYQIMFHGLWHVQNRYEDGAWVYRAVSDVAGVDATDPAVKEDVDGAA